jgi:hypothetical protein
VHVLADGVDAYLNSCWRPALAVSGAAGLPHVKRAGNVLRALTTLSLDMMLPPTANAKHALDLMKHKLSRDVPYGCHVTFSDEHWNDGCTCALPAEIASSFDKSALAFFAANIKGVGSGETSSLISAIKKMYPKSNVLVTGITDSHSHVGKANEKINLV